MAVFDVEILLAEISSDSPCGEDISYDAGFLELERLAEGTAETQVGEHIQEGQEPDWKQVFTLSLELLGRSRDLRLILYLAASALRLEGFSGFRSSLELLRSTVERYWQNLFPQLDPDDDNDPTERINIISALSPPPTVMSDQDPLKFIPQLMETPLCAPEDARLPHPSLRQYLMASGEISTSDPESNNVLSMQIIDAAFEQADIESLQATDQTLSDCIDHIDALDKLLMERVGATATPSFSRIEQVLKQMQVKTGQYMERRGYGPDVSLVKQIQTKVGNYFERNKSDSIAAEQGEEALQTSNNPGSYQGLSGQIASKEDVQKALAMIVSYYEQHEPSSPVPLLIKRAKRLVGKSFVDIIRDISPDAMSQVRIVSGEEDAAEE